MATSLRILVVDDDKDNAQSLAEVFEMEGHRTRVAYNGFEAIEAYKSGDFDIAFMDVMMPGKNGVESFFEIRKLKPQAQIYMMTGFSVEQLLQQAIDHGAMGVLSKPVDVSKLLTVLDDVHPHGIVLIAENDPEFGPAIQRMVESSGYNCELARDGKVALERVVAGGVDVLVLDLKLPLIDGVQVYLRLREMGKAVPTIIMTGNAGAYADTLGALQDVTLTGILNKPFDPIMLLDKLSTLVSASRAALH